MSKLPEPIWESLLDNKFHCAVYSRGSQQFLLEIRNDTNKHLVHSSSIEKPLDTVYMTEQLVDAWEDKCIEVIEKYYSKWEDAHKDTTQQEVRDKFPILDHIEKIRRKQAGLDESQDA